MIVNEEVSFGSLAIIPGQKQGWTIRFPTGKM